MLPLPWARTGEERSARTTPIAVAFFIGNSIVSVRVMSRVLATEPAGRVVKLPPENGVYATTAARAEPRAVACSFRRYRSISANAERRLDQTGTAHDCELRNLACTNSRAPVPCHQMPVWLSQGPLSRHRQERRSRIRAAGARQPVSRPRPTCVRLREKVGRGGRSGTTECLKIDEN